jgi:hypothetical protein
MLLISTNRENPGHPRNCRTRSVPVRAILVLLLSCSGLAARSPSKTAKRETREIRGVVLEVQPSRITLQSKDGESITLTAFDDYTDRLATGAEVKAWYYPQDSGPGVLKTLDYPAESLFVPVGEIQNRVHRLALMPQSEVQDADGLYDVIRDYLHTNFGWYVAPKYLVAEVTRKAQRAGSILDATDAKTGSLDLSKYLNKSQSMMPSLAAQTRSDAVLEVEVVQVEAQVRRLVAAWDGVEQPVAGTATRTLAKFSVMPRRGKVSAATVELKLFDAKGKLLWRNRRGLAVLQVLAGNNHLRDRPLPEFLNDTPAVQTWLSETFKSVGPVAYGSSASKPATPQ